jgi:predicted nucleic acid-binding protein
LLEDLWESGLGCVSVQTLQEFYVNITRKVARPLPPATAAEIIADFEHWTVHAPQVSDVVAAIEIQQRHRLSFWDAMILHSAAQLGCAQVWSEDLQAGRDYDGLRVVNPFA